MSHDRTSRAARTALVTLLQAAVSLGVGLFSAPVMTHYLGRENYGLWMLLCQFVTYLTLLDFGNASIVQIQLASAQHVDGNGEKKRLLSAVRRGLLLTTGPLVLLGLGIAAWAAAKYASAGTSRLTIMATTVLVVMGFLVNRLASLPNYALFGANLVYRSAMLRTAIIAVARLMDIAVVMSGYGLVGLGLVRVAAQTLIGLSLWRTARREIPWFGFTRVGFDEVRRLLRQNVSCVVGQWGHMMADGIDIAIIGCLMGPGMIPVYMVTTALSRLAFQLFSQAMQGATSGLAGLFGAGDRERFQFVRVQQELMAWGCLVVVLAATLPVNRRFVELWVGTEYYGGIVLACLGVAWQFVMVMTRQYNIALSAALEFNRMARVQVLAGVTGIAAAVLGSWWAGVNGLLGGLIAVRVVAVALNAAHLNELLGVSIREQLRRLLWPALVSAGVAGLAYRASSWTRDASWLGIAMTAGLGATCAAAIVWWLVFPAQSRHDLAQRVGQLRQSMQRSRKTA